MKLFCFDFETALIQPGCLAPPIVCMSYCTEDGVAHVVHALDSRLKALIVEALETPSCRMVAHNAAYEAACIMAAWPELTAKLFAKMDAGEYYCTQTGEQLISIGQGDHHQLGFGLVACLRRHKTTAHLAENVDKDCWWRVRYGLLRTTPVELWTDEAYDYAATDARVTFQLYMAQLLDGSQYIHDNTARWEKTPGGKHSVFVPGQTWASVDLHLSSCAGFPTDPEMADEVYKDTLARLKSYEEELLRVGFLMPQRKDGQMQLTLKKAPAQELMVKAYAAQGRDVPRKGLTPKALEKAYAEIGIPFVYQHRKPRGDKEVSKQAIEQALQAGCSPESLLGNICTDEDACINSQHPLLLAYTKYAQANTLKSKVARLQNPLIQTRYNTLVETGRTSSSQGDDPDPGQPYSGWGAQIQNLPRAGVAEDE